MIGEHQQPPGFVSWVSATRALVLAPHYDDEVLGCGGYLSHLERRGVPVAVLFLSDSANLQDAAADPAARVAYAAERRAEAGAALAVLGATWAGEPLNLPDGALANHLPELAAGIEAAILTHRPDVVLVPSPLELTADHQAAFAALHRVLAPLRGPVFGGGLGAPEDAALNEIARALTVLAYEVNHPVYADVLVDVSTEVERLALAMACYPSQQDRYDYLAAGLGLRRYRTLSLPRGACVSAAEGYRRLAAEDFTAFSLAELIRRLGGEPHTFEVREGPPVSVIVRTKDRPALLAEALASLAASSYRHAEVVLVNDGGAPPAVPEDFPLKLVRVDLPTNQGRAAAANAGLAAATGQWISFLDDDDRVSPEHLAVLAGAALGAGVSLVYSDAAVVAYELDTSGVHGGWREVERRLPYSRDFELARLLVDNFIPFNTVLIHRDALDQGAGQPPFDESLEFFEDWDLLLRLALVMPFHHVRRVTCEYRHFRGASHHALGEHGTRRADFLATRARVLTKHAAHLTPERLSAGVEALRFEAVAAFEEIRKTREHLPGLRDRHAEAEDLYHKARLRADAVTAERDQYLTDLQGAMPELERLFGREKELTAVVADQTAHLGRTYAEIERLNGAIEDLKRASFRDLWRWWREAREARKARGEGGSPR